jgi:hypothetical protein
MKEDSIFLLKKKKRENCFPPYESTRFAFIFEGSLVYICEETQRANFRSYVKYIVFSPT